MKLFKKFKYTAIISALSISGIMNAGTFTGRYTIANRLLREGELYYNDINALYQGKNYTRLSLSFEPTSQPSILTVTLQSNPSTGNSNNLEQKELNADVFSSYFLNDTTIRKTGSFLNVFLNKKIDNLGSEEKAWYDFGINIMTQKFGVQIMPQQPWYKRYWHYILGTFGLCAAGAYCYSQQK